jgi:hypothetical protein
MSSSPEHALPIAPESAALTTADATTSALVFGSITLAALALPGLIATSAQAESAPTEGVISLKLQAYNDWQPGLDRIKVVAPSLYVFAPIASQWSIEASAVHDSISGASPRWHTNISGASRMEDRRTAGNAKLTRYFDRVSIGVGASTSNENDYRSNAASMEARISSADNNTTWFAGAGWSSDTINPVNELVVNEHKRTQELMAGVTQVWTRNDLLQLNVGHVRSRGYFNDPYKLADRRPRERDQTTLLVRWNHHIEHSNATVRSSYRFYRDTFGINAHSVQLEVAHPLGERLTVTPSMRYYTQSAANFYFDPVYDPVIGEPFPVGNPKYFSPDQRLSAFGALTLGAKAEWKIDSRWSADIKYERYAQRSEWRLGGGGSPGLAPFSAQFVQLGISRRF